MKINDAPKPKTDDGDTDHQQKLRAGAVASLKPSVGESQHNAQLHDRPQDKVESL